MNNLKSIREYRDMTQRELAEKSGVRLRMIQEYEQGRKDINKAEAIKIYKMAEALDCDMKDIMEL